MKSAADNAGSEQHFPTYHFSNRDVALEEYRFATKALETEERVFINAANLSVIVAAALGSLVLGTLDKIIGALAPAVPMAWTFAVLIVLIYGFTTLSLRYFADRHKSVVFATRKVIVLRRMLGLSYGSFQLVLPNWRIEGADEPFAVRLFPGWSTYATYPCYAIAGITSVVILFVTAVILNSASESLGTLPFTALPVVLGSAAIWFIVLCWKYRKALLDTHETRLLLIAFQISRLLRLGLVENFEHTIYRAKLASFELFRLNVELKHLKHFLVQIEDKQFYSHHGTSIQGLARLSLSALRLHRRSGGSTITQQLVRTLFIVDQTKLVRRKLVEILFAHWFDGVISKSMQLDLYLSSVRFEKHVFGIPQAMRFFFGEINKQPSPAHAFFLIERVSNIRSRLLVQKVRQNLESALDAGLLSECDVKEVVELYAKAIAEGKIKNASTAALDSLRNVLREDPASPNKGHSLTDSF